MTAAAEAQGSAAFPFRWGLWAGLVVLADFLFWGHEIGWTAGLFCLVVLCATALCNRRR